ncbi:MAG TPA: hypothetical protein VNK92_03650 [Vicinamibacterales bacterium]|nr:hypothetical protein [Vicinamibacterales bacterium]
MELEQFRLEVRDLFAGVDRRFAQVALQFDGVHERFAQVDVRFQQVDARMDRLEERMDRLEARMDRLEERMDRLEARMDSLETRVDRLERRMEEGFEAQKTRTDALFEQVRSEIRLVAEAVVNLTNEVRQALDRPGEHGKRLDDHELRLRLLERRESPPS